MKIKTINQKPNKHILSILLILALNSFFIGFSHVGEHSIQNKFWNIQDNTKTIEGNYIYLKDQKVFLRDEKTSSIINFPLTDFSMEDQLLILKQNELSEKINLNKSGKYHLEITEVKRYSKNKALILLLFSAFLLFSIIFYFGFQKARKTALISIFCSSFVLVLVACSSDADQVPDDVVTTSPTPSTEPTSNNTSTDTSSTDTSSSNNSQTTEGSSIDTIISYFEKFSGVSINSDNEYFYINSYSWPEHGMGVGINSWQEQVAIPQNYTGDNSWRIPLNPVMADNPVDTSVNLFRGAIAIAVNGIPIFNAVNNRGVNAYEAGELDNWGGHFGKGDDYHYHLIPTHLEETVGIEQPLAYALDGYPVYGYTNETLDDAFGRYDNSGNYQYHAKTIAPYYMPLVMGEINVIDDEISPQPSQNPIRPSDSFKPVSGASVTGFSQTGVNAFSFEYTVEGIKYYVNYNWDENCKFTFTYVDENGETTNLPHNGSLSDDSLENSETFINTSACIDVDYLSGSYNISSNDSSSSLSEISTGFSATSDKSDFTLTSVAINSEGEILDAFKCEEKVNGIEKSIPIAWSNIPEGTGSIAISIHGFPNANETNSYLTLWNINPSVTEIQYGEANSGEWFMGPNKDGGKISYSSPCSPSGGTSTYYMTIYALSEAPSSLPKENSLTINYSALVDSLSEVTIIDQVVLEYTSSSN